MIAGILRAASVGPKTLNAKILNLAGSELVSLDKIVSTSNEILNKSAVIIDGGKTPSIRNPSIKETTNILEWQPTIGLRIGLEKCLLEMIVN